MNKIRNIHIKCNNLNDIYYLDLIQKRNLRDLREALNVAIQTEDKQMLKFMIHNWYLQYQSILIDEDIRYIINHTNQINHINYLMQEALYIINKE